MPLFKKQKKEPFPEVPEPPLEMNPIEKEQETKKETKEPERIDYYRAIKGAYEDDSMKVLLSINAYLALLSEKFDKLLEQTK